MREPVSLDREADADLGLFSRLQRGPDIKELLLIFDVRVVPDDLIIFAPGAGTVILQGPGLGDPLPAVDQCSIRDRDVGNEPCAVRTVCRPFRAATAQRNPKFCAASGAAPKRLKTKRDTSGSSVRKLPPLTVCMLPVIGPMGLTSSLSVIRRISE